MEELELFVYIFWGIFLMFLHFLFKLIFRNYKIIEKPKCKNTWAVVTGGTSGIGESFVYKLYNLGYNVFVISRNKEKLLKLQEKLPNIVIHESDFTKLDIYEELNSKLNDIQVSLLINNVGMLGKNTEFENNHNNSIDKILKCNIYSCVYVTKICILNMKKNNIKGVILNLSSISSKIPFPYYSLYAATKSFMDTFFKNISIENTNLKIKTINPFFVSTNMTKKKQSIFCPSSETYVEHIINKGYYLPHSFINIIIIVFKTFFINNFENYMKNFLIKKM